MKLLNKILKFYSFPGILIFAVGLVIYILVTKGVKELTSAESMVLEMKKDKATYLATTLFMFLVSTFIYWKIFF